MNQIDIPVAGFLVQAWRSTFSLLLLITLALCGCSGETTPASPATASPGKKTDAVAGETETPAEKEPAKKLSPGIKKVLEDIQPENPPAVETTKTPTPPETVKTPEPAKTTPAPPETVKAPEPAKTTPAPEGIDEKKMLDSLQNRMILLARAFESGELDSVKKFLVTDDDLKAILTSGGYGIVGISLESQNETAVTQTLKAIKDKKFEHEFTPGKMTFTPNNGIFKKKVPTMSQSKLLLKIDGTPSPFIFYIKQLVWLEEDWKVFNAGI